MSTRPLVCLVAVVALFLAGAGQALVQDKAAPAPKVANFTLKDFRGKTWSLDNFKDSKLVVLAFVGAECPLAKLYGPRLAKLAEEYGPKGVAFVGIDANAQDSVTKIAAYAQQHKIDFPILKDLENKLADLLGAERTPEVFLLDPAREVRYHGRIDDQFGVGYAKDQPKRKDLAVAIDELLAGKAVSQPVTKAEGCFIGRVPKAKGDNAVTYTKHIAPILQKQCVECHRDGEIAPFALTRYDEVVGWADTIVEVTREGRMPPWHADPKHGKFANERKLSDAEKTLIAQWVKNGTPEGDPKDLPKAKSYVTGWQLPRQPDVVLPLTPAPYKVPALGPVKYIHFQVNPGFKEDKWIEGAQVLPGNRAVLHHVLSWAIPPGKFQEMVAEINEGGAGFLAGYVPGQLAYTFPKGMAKRIPAGSQLIFQVHYTPNGSEQLDQTRLGLLFADPKTITHEVKTMNALNRGFKIPAGGDNHKVTATPRVIKQDMLLLGLMPHMHLRGKSFQYTAEFPGSKKEILLDVPHFDFAWQTAYRLETPLPLPAGTKMHCVAHYDNSEGNLSNPNPKIDVKWGPQTYQEMMIGYFDVAIPLKAKATAP